MIFTHVLRDLRSGNVVTDFASEREAWETLRNWATADGLASVADFSLLRLQDGHPVLIAMEEELTHRVARELSDEGVAPPHRQRPSGSLGT